jgi:hypothetical protein
MAVNTSNTILNYSTDDGTTWTKLVDITSYPDLGATPSKLDTTTLTATKFKTSILGLQEIPDLTFEANYDPTDFQAIVALEGQKLALQLAFGDAGADGSFEWEGEVSVFVSGGGVDEVRMMSVTCSAETEIVSA